MFYALVTLRNGDVHALTCKTAHLSAKELVIRREGSDCVVFDLAFTSKFEVRCLRSNVKLICESYPFTPPRPTGSALDRLYGQGPD